MQWEYDSFFDCHTSTTLSFLQVHFGPVQKLQTENLDDTVEDMNGMYVI